MVTAGLYLHSIMTAKMHCSAAKNLSLFSKIIGNESMSNVGLVTTHWDVAPNDEAIDREAYLITNAWGVMLENKARKYRLYNDLDSAQNMMTDMLKASAKFIKI